MHVNHADKQQIYSDLEGLLLVNEIIADYMQDFIYLSCRVIKN